MKLSELKPCAVCKGPLPPIWQVVRVSMALLSQRSANTVLGMAQMFGGNLALAEVMAPAPEEAVVIAGDKDPRLMMTVHICQVCFLNGPIDLALIAETASFDEAIADANTTLIAAAAGRIR